MNNREREMWIENDEGLCRWKGQWCRQNPGGMRGFIQENREELDAIIDAALNRTPAESRW